MLADGMGGALDGAVIARETVETLHRCLETPGLRPIQLLDAIEDLNTSIYQRYHENGGTTLIVVRITEQGLWFASVGDSNIWLARAGRLYELNRRHEFLYDLYERVLDGVLSLEDALDNKQAKALSSYIGCGSLRIDSTQRPLPLQTGDALLVCSDGISDTLSVQQLREALEHPAQECAGLLEALIEAAASPNQDNYTAIIVRIDTEG